MFLFRIKWGVPVFHFADSEFSRTDLASNFAKGLWNEPMIANIFSRVPEWLFLVSIQFRWTYSCGQVKTEAKSALDWRHCWMTSFVICDVKAAKKVRNVHCKYIWQNLKQQVHLTQRFWKSNHKLEGRALNEPFVFRLPNLFSMRAFLWEIQNTIFWIAWMKVYNFRSWKKVVFFSAFGKRLASNPRAIRSSNQQSCCFCFDFFFCTFCVQDLFWHRACKQIAQADLCKSDPKKFFFKI